MARVKATTTSANTSQIVSSANVVERTGISLTGTIGIARFQEWAPAWFYSALNWLDKSYVDANNTEQAFTNYMYGSDVDPYAQLGNTRLFFIALQDDVFVLSIAPNLTSTATVNDYALSEEFTLSPAAASAVVNQLSVPVLATVTTTPARIIIPDQKWTNDAVKAAAAKNAAFAPARGTVTGTVSTIGELQGIGTGGTTPSQAQLSPKTIQIPLNATVPQVVLTATNVSSIELGTAFPQQTIGAGATFEIETDGTILNLMAAATPALAPFTLTLASTGVTFASGVTYTFSLLGNSLTISGSDGSAPPAQLPAGANTDTTHTFIGMVVYTSNTTTVPLYPLIELSFAAPAVGTNGVTQGTTYSVRLTIGTPTSSYDIIDATQTVVSASISVATPKPTDNSQPQAGAYYFGTYTGGASTINVWSIPIFLAVTPAEVEAVGFGGTMTLGAQVSGLPTYNLAITDSSLFVYSNINIDTAAIGSLSANNVYIASAVINSAPDDHSPQAFAPSKLLMGIIRQVQMGGYLVYVFIPKTTVS